MPLEESAEYLLDNNFKYFYNYTLGCTGVLKRWLNKAYALALKEHAKSLTKDHLERTKLSDYRVIGLLKGIEEGEKRMAKL